MLYIFLVDIGHMIPVDMKLALESVGKLKSEINRQTGIPEDKQVLLISGGESLNTNERVCSYSAGTDTSPIFLFSKISIESPDPPLPCSDYGDDCDMKEQVESCLSMPPTYHTVVSRAQLAQRFYEIAKTQRVSCEKLVYHQHLQQQGWAAVVANLEDIASSFKNKTTHFETNFIQYLDSRNYHLELLKSFSQDLNILSKIPLLPVLLIHDDETSLKYETGISLLQWISSKDNQTSLEQVTDKCVDGLRKIDKNTFDGLRAEIQKALEAVDNSQMKEIKGLGERLMGLETLMCEAKRYESEQADIAQALFNNQNQAGKLGDSSILPDLCISHKQQLELLLKNHQNLRDIRRRCARAKEELSQNLHSRLRWIMFVEKTICDVENRMMMYHDILKRLRRYLEVIQQIHLAPKIYLNAVVEVVRRKSFSRSFMQWSESLSQQSLELRKKEVAARKTFNSQISNHFLKTLFPGMKDFPPPFAIQVPALFDTDLPNIEIDDVEKLKQQLPEMADYLKIPAQYNMPRASSTPTDSAFGSEIPSSRAQGTGSITSPTSLEPLPHLLEVHELETGEGFSEIDKEILSLASEPSPSSESFECTDHEVITKQIKSPEKAQYNYDEDYKLFHSSEAILKKDIFSPVEEEQREIDSDTEEFEQVGDLPKDQSLSEYRKVGIRGESSTRNRLQKGASNPEDAKLKQNTEVIALTRTYSDGYLHLPTACPIMSPESCMTSSQEFITADYFIDESMPSSYTESSGTTKGSQIKSHHVLVAEIQHQLEEKASTLIAVQRELDINRSQLDKIQCIMMSLQKIAWEISNQLKSDVVQLRDQVLEGKETFFEEIANVTMQLNDSLERIQRNIQNDKHHAIHKALLKAQNEHQALIMHYQTQLEIESQKVDDSHRQVEMYYDQLQHYSTLLDSMKMEHEIKLSQARKEVKDENNELVKNLMLEHEMELENLRENFEIKINSMEEEIKYLKELVMEKENQIHLLCENKTTLENIFTERLQQEKAQFQKLLEEKYREQENIAVCQALKKQEEIHEEEYQRFQIQREEFERELQSKIRKELEIEFEKKLQSCSEEVIDIHSHQHILSELKTKCEEEKMRAVAEVIEMQEKKFQTEIENLKLEIHKQYQEEFSAVKSEPETAKKMEYATAKSEQVAMPSDKVSVLTCDVGDVVLLCFDEKHDNYMVFFLGPILHFLHTDCVETLGFKNVSCENRKKWALAEVVHKEYCQAKKPHNRYKVPVGTRFYRVKAKPWDKEMVVRRHHHQRNTSAGGGTGSSDSSQSSLSAAAVTSPSNMSASVI